jgi:hypothetical protein
MEMPCKFRIMRGCLVATLTVANAGKIVYGSSVAFTKSIENKFNMYIEGYEQALRFAATLQPINPVEERTANYPMTLVYDEKLSRGPFVTIVSDRLREKFLEFEDQIAMSPIIRGEPVVIGKISLDEVGLALCKIAPGSIPENADVFPVLIDGLSAPDTEEGRAIPRGFNNYVIVRDHFMWSLRWPIQ